MFLKDRASGGTYIFLLLLLVLEKGRVERERETPV